MTKDNLDQRIEAAVLHSWAVRDLDGTGYDQEADPARSIPPFKQLLADVIAECLPAPQNWEAGATSEVALERRKVFCGGFNAAIDQVKQAATNMGLEIKCE